MNADKEKIAIERLKAFNKDDEPYHLCYSGGKDSDTIRILAELANVNFEVHNNHTTVDSPTTVYYIREQMMKYGKPTEYRDKDGLLIRQFGEKGFIHFPKYTMWELIPKKMIPPTRLARYCCAELKEKGGKGRRKLTGVRWAESRNRQDNQGLVTIIGKEKGTAKMCEELNANFSLTSKGGVVLNTDNDASRRAVESCYRTTSTLINPIIDWTDEDVWDFLHHYGCESNPEYKCGKNRVGCVGCPQQGNKRYIELEQYPAYKNNYLKAFQRMLDVRKAKGKDDTTGGWIDAEHVYRWWIGENPLQITMEDYIKMLEEEQEVMEHSCNI